MPHSPVGKVDASPLRNPFTFQRYGSEAIGLFRNHLFKLVKAQERSVMTLMDAIDEDTALACWCVTMDGEEIFKRAEECHCQVIWKCWRWMKQGMGVRQ